MRDIRSVWRLYSAFACAYAAFGLMFGFLQGAIAPILRLRGMPLEQVGLTFLFLIPFCISSLWAPLIDRIDIAANGRRGWIGLSAVGVVAAVIVAAAFPEHGAALLTVGFAASFCLATMDAALEGIVADTAAPDQRPLIAGLRIGALSLGGIVGGGAMIALYPTLGWGYSFMLIAGLFALLAGTAAGQLPSARPATKRDKVDLRSVLRYGLMRQVAIFAFVAASMAPMFGLARVMMVDIGAGSGLLAWTGIFVPAGALAGTAIAAPLLRAAPRIGPAVFGIVALGTAGMLLIAAYLGMPILAGACTVLGGASAAAIYVAMMSRAYRLGAGPASATRVTLLLNGQNLAGTLGAAGLAAVVPHIGWPVFYASTATAFAVALLIFLSTEPPKPRQSHPGRRLLRMRPDRHA